MEKYPHQSPEEPILLTEIENDVSTEAGSMSSRLEITWPEESDPIKRVDAFLEDLALICRDSEMAWKEVRSRAGAISAVRTEVNASLSRDQRRKINKLPALSDEGAVLGMVKSVAQNGYEQLTQTCSPQTTYEDFLQAGEQQHREQVAMMTAPGTPAPLVGHISGVTDQYTDLLRVVAESAKPYTQAYLTRDIVLGQLNHLLTDDQVAEALFDRLDGLTKIKSGGIEEYPGFLSIIATHALQEGDNNILTLAMQRIQPPVSHYSVSFLQELMKQESSVRRKEMNVAVCIMRLTSTLVSSNFETSQDDWLKLMAQHVGDWPEELKMDLQTMVARIHLSEIHKLKESLKPFERPGRLPLAQGTTTIQIGKAKAHGPGSARGTQLSASRSKKHSTQATTVRISAGQRGQDHLKVSAPEAEKQAITRFAIIGRQTKPGTYEIVPVASLQELYEQSNLADYTRRHAADKTLEPFFKTALEKLTVDAFDPRHTEKLKSIRFDIEGRNGASRRGYRMRPRGLSGTAFGPITRDTRIIFDVVPIGNEPTLVIHGAFIKHDIADMEGDLPSRR